MTSEPAEEKRARADSERMAELRLLRDIELIGGLGRIDYRGEGSSSAERAQRTGPEGEELTAKRLEKHLRGSGVVVMHGLPIPGTQTQIDHVCIGPGGVTVIINKSYEGTAELRRGELWINGRSRMRLIDRVCAQLGLMRMVLAEAQIQSADLAGALAIVNLDGQPLADSLRLDGILIDTPQRVARLAKRQPHDAPIDVDAVTGAIGARLVRKSA